MHVTEAVGSLGRFLVLCCGRERCRERRTRAGGGSAPRFGRVRNRHCE
ncbi:hypothetical protein M2163_009051 [Streptomyces sp. SAI-135]|nr:hypothetical protein [Streptomyces sp. SAI-090]MDH6621943.1 hypothetical protein [Streptomyces sp. SAI-135]